METRLDRLFFYFSIFFASTATDDDGDITHGIKLDTQRRTLLQHVVCVASRPSLWLTQTHTLVFSDFFGGLFYIIKLLKLEMMKIWSLFFSFLYKNIIVNQRKCKRDSTCFFVFFWVSIYLTISKCVYRPRGLYG